MATFAVDDGAGAKAASDFFTTRLCVMGFAMLGLLIMPIMVIRCEYYALTKQSGMRWDPANPFGMYGSAISTEEVTSAAWIHQGVFVAALLSVSALSYESLMLKSDGLVTLVAACDGCCGVYLLLEAVAESLACVQTDLFASLPIYKIVVIGSTLILGGLLVLLAICGVQLRNVMLKDHEASATAEVVESFEIRFVKEGAYGLRFSELEGKDQLKVKEIQPDGCVAKFNQATPESAICVGDLITEINGGAAATSTLAGAAEGHLEAGRLVRAGPKG